MRRVITKAVSVMMAAALVCSIAPTASLAAVQQGSMVPVVKAQQARDATQISIDIPASLDFASAGGLIIQEKDTWGPLTAAVSFENHSNQGLYISSINLEQKDGCSLANLYSGGSVAMSLAGRSDDASASVPVGSSSAVAFAMPDEPEKSFGIASGSKASFELTMDGQSAILQDDDTLKGEAEGGDLVGVASVAWTFAVYDDEEDRVEDHGGFFLLDGPTQQVYGVEEVKAHAEDIERNGTSSQHYGRYLAYARGTRDYTCRYAFKKDTLLNPDYRGVSVRDMKIIGVNHDDRVDASGNIIGKAGLTFWIETVSPFVCDAFGTEFGVRNLWRDSQVRLAYQPESNGGNGTFYDLIPDKVKRSIVPVYKQTYSHYEYGGYNYPLVTDTIDYAFVPSAKEVGVHSTIVRVYPNRIPPEEVTLENQSWETLGAGALAQETKMSKYEHDLSIWPHRDGYSLCTRSALSDPQNPGCFLLEAGWSNFGFAVSEWDKGYEFMWRDGGASGYASVYFGMAFCF